MDDSNAHAIADIEHMFHEFDKIDADFGNFHTKLGSAFHSDQQCLPSWNLPNMAPQLLGTAIDHIHTLRRSSGQPSRGHAEWSARSPWTLLRAALECSSMGIWLSAPEDQDDRIERSLRLLYDDKRNQFKAERYTYRPRDRERVQSLESWDRSEFSRLASTYDSSRVRQEPGSLE